VVFLKRGLPSDELGMPLQGVAEIAVRIARMAVKGNMEMAAFGMIEGIRQEMEVVRKAVRVELSKTLGEVHETQETLSKMSNDQVMVAQNVLGVRDTLLPIVTDTKGDILKVHEKITEFQLDIHTATEKLGQRDAENIRNMTDALLPIVTDTKSDIVKRITGAKGMQRT
jgi:hypothetical protein